MIDFGILDGKNVRLSMTTTATVKGQIVIPAEVRAKLGIKGGTRLNVEVDEAGRIILTPVTTGFIKNIYGRRKGNQLLDALAHEKKRERER
jgi:AbrB family looped-hinge helix DNA binding protein